MSKSESITDGTCVRKMTCTADGCDETVYYLQGSPPVVCKSGHSVVVSDDA